MENIKKIIKFILNSNYRFRILSGSGKHYQSMSNEKYLKKKFRAEFGYDLDLDHPKTFNEKLQWLKINYYDPIYPTLVDKYEVKAFVADKIGSDQVIKTLGVWNSFDEIDFSKLPDKFVLKTTHDSGGVVVCKDKKKLNINEAKAKLETHLNNDFYYIAREWPYKEVKRRIIAEEFLDNNSNCDLKDYKFFCFNGEVKFFKVDIDRFTNHRANYYDVHMKLLPFGEADYPFDESIAIQRPKNLDIMIRYAKNMSYGMPFVRIDFYDVNGHIYFGEFTFFPAGGFGKISPFKYDEEIGKLLDLSLIEGND